MSENYPLAKRKGLQWVLGEILWPTLENLVDRAEFDEGCSLWIEGGVSGLEKLYGISYRNIYYSNYISRKIQEE